ncbi:MAG TPA: cation:proton antiporter, partial [Flavobacteriaceae bacterium]|nr:cation:proton antiporter [Flavobacteriaceae bacterium]
IIFSLILFIILIIPNILNRIKIPGIIGLIIAGIIIGPKGLNFFIEEDSFVEIFSTIGLLYIMFIAGLELDLNLFKANRNKSIAFGFLTFIIPLGLGFPIFYYLLHPIDPNIDLNASLLIASMFATHTLLTYPIVSKLGISKNRAVAITVGGTILTDTAVLLLLAVIIGSHNGNLSQEFWIQLIISLILFSLVMFVVMPRIAKWFFRKLESEKHSHFIFVLSVVFFASFLAEVAGLESIIGAFFAGLALNKLIPASSALMNRIEFIGNSLFIPFFLISVGMKVDLAVIFEGPTALIIAAVLTVVALAGKWLAAWATQLIFKFTKTDRQLIFGLSSAHAAATLAVIMVGVNEGILDDNVLNGTIILILVTCIVASFATEKAAVKAVLEGDQALPDEDGDKHKDEQILIPIANPKNMSKVLEFAILIKDKKSKNPLDILTVVPNDTEAEINIKKANEGLEEFIKDATASDTQADIISTIDHNPGSGMARMAKETMADIILLGWPRRIGFIDKLIGEKLDLVLKTDKLLFICDFHTPMIDNKKIAVAVPPFAELEMRFELWVDKVTELAKELSLPLVFYCNETTEKTLQKLADDKGVGKNTSFELLDDWNDFLILSRSVGEGDLFILVSARRGSVSYLHIQDNLPTRMERYFQNNNKIIVYP